MVRMKDKRDSILVKRRIGNGSMGRLSLAGSLISPQGRFGNAEFF